MTEKEMTPMEALECPNCILGLNCKTCKKKQIIKQALEENEELKEYSKDLAISNRYERDVLIDRIKSLEEENDNLKRKLANTIKRHQKQRSKIKKTK